MVVIVWWWEKEFIGLRGRMAKKKHFAALLDFTVVLIKKTISKYGTPNVVTISGITLDNLYNCCSLNSVMSKLDFACKVWDELVMIK